MQINNFEILKQKSFYILLILSILAININAQKVSVRTTLDSATMVIGQQSLLTFQIDQMPAVKVQSPIFSDSLPGGLELVGLPRIDTVKADDGLISIRQRYIVTAFNEAVYTVPKLPFVNGKDTAWSNSVSIKVIQPFQIDTVTNTFADIKPVMKPPFDWIYLFKVVLLIFLIVCILAFAVFFIFKLLKKKPLLFEKKPEKPIPPDILALQKLDKIKEEKLWQHGRVKEYHTQVTDVLREYIAAVFGIGCMEMTSDQILENLEDLKHNDENSYNAIKQTLKLADLAKFAKHQPFPSENEQSLKNAYEFVNATKSLIITNEPSNNESVQNILTAENNTNSEESAK